MYRYVYVPETLSMADAVPGLLQSDHPMAYVILKYFHWDRGSPPFRNSEDPDLVGCLKAFAFLGSSPALGPQVHPGPKHCTPDGTL
jgi:hypothetical protein